MYKQPREMEKGVIIRSSTSAGESPRSEIVSRYAARVIRRHPVATVFCLALLLRLFVSFAVTPLFGYEIQSPDSYGYQSMLTQAATGDTGAWDQFTKDLYGSIATFSIPLTVLYRVLSPSFAVGQIFVGVVGAAVAAAVTRLAMEAVPVRWALAGGVTVALLPSQALFSSQVLKDPFVWAALAGTAVALAWAASATTVKSLVIRGAVLAAALSSIAYLRIHTFVAAAIAVALASWVGTAARRVTRTLIVLGIAIAVPWVVGLGPLGWDFISEPKNLDSTRHLNAADAASSFVQSSQQEEELQKEATALVERARQLYERADDLEEGDERAAPLRRRARELETRAQQISEEMPSVQLAEGNLHEPALAYLPRGLVAMLLRPFPWESGSASLRFAGLESIVWYPLLALALLGLPCVYRAPKIFLFPALVGGASLFIYAAAEGNLGSAFRHRGEFVWVVALLACAGAATLFSQRERLSSRERDQPAQDEPGRAGPR